MEDNLRQLLFKDLSARLPYDVICHANEINLDGELLFINKVYNIVALYNDKAIGGKFDTCPIADIKPYLRSMSSMTEEEYNSVNWEGCRHVVYYDENGFYFVKIDSFTIPVLDYLNARHFDFRYLIEKGLALEAPEGVYKNE